jgi:lysozyme family protein
VADVLRMGMLLGDLDDVGTTEQLASNFNKDWYFWYKMHPYNSGSAAVNAATMFPIDTPLDIRSRRVSKDMGRTSLFCFVNGSATSLTFDVFVRQLVALP